MILDKVPRDKVKYIYFISIFMGILVSYVLVLFLYLQIVGVYGVATIKKQVATSDGIDITYEFSYENEKYNGVFTTMDRYRNGDKYFVLFSRSRPGKNLLQYNSQVPDCLKDSVNLYWSKQPTCNLR